MFYLPEVQLAQRGWQSWHEVALSPRGHDPDLVSVPQPLWQLVTLQRLCTAPAAGKGPHTRPPLMSLKSLRPQTGLGLDQRRQMVRAELERWPLHPRGLGDGHLPEVRAEVTSLRGLVSRLDNTRGQGIVSHQKRLIQRARLVSGWRLMSGRGRHWAEERWQILQVIISISHYSHQQRQHCDY